MKHLYITGSSSGIGKGIADAALAAGMKVTGISRRPGIDHPNFRHIAADLYNLDAMEQLSFSADEDEWVLVNNAGTIGDVKPVAELNPNKVAESFFLNLTAPVILSQKFIAAAQKQGKNVLIINISSGAARFAIPSWSTYCAAKAGLDHFTRVVQTDHPEVKCLGISPGIVDTEMQDDIRSRKPEDFPEHKRFVEYKKNNELQNPTEVGQKILKFVTNPEKAPDTIFELRDVG